MKVLIIGGTGTISSAITAKLLKDGEEVYLLNRGNHNSEFPGAKSIIADINDEADVCEKIKNQKFDTVCDFVCFTKERAESDFRIFNGNCSQFIFISSASAYNKPVKDYVITEGTSLANKYWEYSRNKIACEEFFMAKYRECGFPVTIVRPSHTYCEKSVPMGVHGNKGSYQVLKRMLDGKKVLVHGDGTSLWTITFNTDFAKGFTGLLQNPHAIGEAFQITSDESLTWNQIYELVAKALGVEFKPYYVSSSFLTKASDYDFEGSLTGDKSNTVVFDNSKLKAAVPGLLMNVSAEKGIKAAVDYIMSHPECQTEDPEFDEWCDKVIAELDKAVENIRR